MSDRETLKSAVRPTPECLSPAELERVAGSPDQSDAHVSRCPRCQAEVSMLRAFESDAPLPDEGAAVAWIGSQLERGLEEIKGKRPPRQRERWSLLDRLSRYARLQVLVPIAAGIVVAGGVVLLRAPKQPELSAHIGNSPILRSEEIGIVGPVGELKKVPEKLEWEAAPGASSYQVELMEVDQTPLWNSVMKDNSVTIPSTVRASLIKGKPLLWRVTARDQQDRVVGRSQLQRFMISEGAR